MDDLESLFNNINIAGTETQIIKNDMHELKILLQHRETLVWIKKSLVEHKGFSADILTQFLQNLKIYFYKYISCNFNESNLIIKELMILYNNNIDSVLSNTAPAHVTVFFLIELAFQIHKMLLIFLKIER